MFSKTFSQTEQQQVEAGDELTELDQRESERHPRTGPIWWTSERHGKLKMARVTDRAEDSIAFLAKGDVSVQPGDPVWLLSSMPRDDGRDAPKRAMIARVHNLHSDLFLVAVTLVPTAQ